MGSTRARLPPADSTAKMEQKGYEKSGLGSFLVRLMPTLAILAAIIYSVNGEVFQFLHRHQGTADKQISVGLNLIVCHSGGLVFAPFLFCGGRSASTLSVSITKVATMSFVVASLLMAYNYAWVWSAVYVNVGLTNALFQTSIALVYVGSVFFFAEPITFPRVVGVILALAGSFMASSVSEHSGSSDNVIRGLTFAIFAALGNTLYQIIFRHQFGHLKSDPYFLAYFGFWVSAWHIVAMLPLLWVADVTGFERTQIPSGYVNIVGTLTTAVLATVVNVISLSVVMWGSPMLLPCSSALSIPATLVLDALLHNIMPSRSELFGHILIIASFVLIMDFFKMLPGNKDVPEEV